jgi:TM2 domain-containing membrane protein YozV
MQGARNSYEAYGRRAARFSIFFPGVGQLYNRQYSKGIVVIILCSFAVAFLFLLVGKPGQNVGLPALGILTLLPLVVWIVSIVDAYYSAIYCRMRDAKRFNVQLLTTIQGADAGGLQFQEVGVTRNLSKVGACLIMSRDLTTGARIHLEFEGFPKTSGRVVWARETGNLNERWVGVELLRPIREL